MLVGGIFYVIDDLFGTALRAAWHNMTHKEKLPAGVKQGFIEGKLTSERFWPTIIVAAIGFLLFKDYFAVTLVGKIGIYLVALFGTTLGFIAGPWFRRIYSKKDKALDVLGRLETGKIDLSEEAKELASKLTQGAGEMATSATHAVSGAFSDALEEAGKHIHFSEAEPAEEKKIEPPAIKENPGVDDEFRKAQEGIDKFINS
jgi:hypothetical protein